MRVRLVFVTGSQAGTTIEVQQQEITIGRNPRSTVTFLPDEVVVSGRHAKVYVENGVAYLRDEGSRNGTFVNGQRIDVIELAPGQTLMFGPNGPTARVEAVDAGVAPATAFVPESALGAPPTVSPPAAAPAAAPAAGAGSGSGLTGLYHMARAGADQRAGGRASQTSIMKEFVRLAADRTSRRNRMIIAGVAVGAVIAIAGVYILGQRQQAGLEGALAELTGVLESERGARAALQEQLTSLSGQAEEWQMASESLRTETDEMRQQVAQGQRELAQQRAAVEQDRRFGPTVTQRFASGVGIIQVVYGYRDASGSWLHLQGNADGRIGLTTSGGVPFEMAGHGTGFLVDAEGWLITNRHVAQMGLGEQLEIGGQHFESQPRRSRIYFPPGDKVYDFTVEGVYQGGENAPDLGLLRLQTRPSGVPVLPVATRANVVPGEDVVMLGYPGGAEFTTGRVGDPAIRDAMVRAGQQAQSQWIQQGNLGPAFERLQQVRDGKAEALGTEDLLIGLLRQVGYLAMLDAQGQHRQIQPHLAMASVSDTTARTIIYSAVGGSIGGSSGGAIIGRDLLVVAVNFAGQAKDDRGMSIQRQIGVPARFIWDLLPSSVASRARH